MSVPGRHAGLRQPKPSEASPGLPLPPAAGGPIGGDRPTSSGVSPRCAERRGSSGPEGPKARAQGVFPWTIKGLEAPKREETHGEGP